MIKRKTIFILGLLLLALPVLGFPVAWKMFFIYFSGAVLILSSVKIKIPKELVSKHIEYLERKNVKKNETYVEQVSEIIPEKSIEKLGEKMPEKMTEKLVEKVHIEPIVSPVSAYKVEERIEKIHIAPERIIGKVHSFPVIETPGSDVTTLGTHIVRPRRKKILTTEKTL